MGIAGSIIGYGIKKAFGTAAKPLIAFAAFCAAAFGLSKLFNGQAEDKDFNFSNTLETGLQIVHDVTGWGLDQLTEEAEGQDAPTLEA